MNRRVLLDKSDYDQYVIPFPGKMRGKAAKAYVLQEMEKRHPCFMNRCIWSSGKNDGQSLVVTVIDKEVLKANYTKKHGSLWVASPETGKQLRFRTEKEIERKKISAITACFSAVFIFLAGTLFFLMTKQDVVELIEERGIMIETDEKENEVGQMDFFNDAETANDVVTEVFIAPLEVVNQDKEMKMESEAEKAGTSIQDLPVMTNGEIAAEAVEAMEWIIPELEAVERETVLKVAEEVAELTELADEADMTEVAELTDEAGEAEVAAELDELTDAESVFGETSAESETEESFGMEKGYFRDFVFPGEIIQNLKEKKCRIMSVEWEFFPCDDFSDNLIFYFIFSGFYPEQLYEIAEKWSSLEDQHFYVESVWYENGNPECRCVFMTQTNHFDHGIALHDSLRFSVAMSPLSETRTAFVKNGGIPVTENVDECTFSGLIEGQLWPDFCGDLISLSHKGILPEKASFSVSEDGKCVSVLLKMKKDSKNSFPLESVEKVFSFFDPESINSEETESEEKPSMQMSKAIKEVGRIRTGQGIRVYYHDEKGHLKSFLMEENR